MTSLSKKQRWLIVGALGAAVVAAAPIAFAAGGDDPQVRG